MNYNDPPLDPTDPLGTDLELNVNGDLVLTPQGDIELVSGVQNVKQMIRVRLQTRPDSYIFGTDLGSELGQTIDAPLSNKTQQDIQQFTTQALQDPRISNIDSVNGVDPNDGSMQYQVAINVTVAGDIDVQTTVPVGGGP